jgi:DNA-binding transcriptional LysR family regulator
MATVLPDILRGFHRRFPGIRLELNESPTSAQITALQAGEIDCGFFHPDAPTPGIETTVLLRERNGILLPADHPLRSKKAIRLKDLAGTPFVMFPRPLNPGFYDRVLAAFAAAAVAPRIAEEVWPRANGVGLVGPAPESRLVVGWRGAQPPTPALAALLAAAAAHASL